MERVVVLLAIVALVAAVATVRRARDGRVRALPTDAGPAAVTDLAALADPGAAITLVEFTAPTCSTCAAARAVLEEVASGRDVAVVDVDVADALDVARAHRVMRAPTTLVVAADGALLGRVAGIPRRDELAALLDAAEQVRSAA